MGNCLFQSWLGSLFESATTPASVLIWNTEVLTLQRCSVQSSVAISDSESISNVSIHFPLYARFSIGFWHGLDSELEGHCATTK